VKDVDDLLTRIWSDLAARVHGPFAFRFLLQPLMGLIYAARDGIVDARQGRPAYFWTIFTRPGERWELLREGGKAVARVIALGVVMDVVYQLLVFHRIHPLQLVVVVLALAFVPYLILRGPISRIARAWMTRHVRT
jgi:hypothetical protein